MPSTSTDLITIYDSHIIGKGAERLCYRHPANPKLCIKIKYRERAKLPQNESDYKYYSYLQRQNISWKHITRCYGWVETDKGKGLLFDLPYDSDGNNLKTLDELIKSGRITFAEVLRQVDYLQQYLIENKVLVSEFSLVNILYDPSLAGDCKLIIVDGVGDRNFFTPIVQKFRFLTKLRLDKKLENFRRDFYKYFGSLGL